MNPLSAFLPAILIAATMTASPAFATAEEPLEIVRVTTEELYKRVDADRELFEKDVSKLRNVVREVLIPRVDKIYSARLVLGRAGRDLERQQVEEFADALSELLIKQYADVLLEFKDRDQVQVLDLVGDNTERMTRVRTRIRLPSGARVPVDYVFRKSGGEWVIFDVIAEGISYVATFRNQIGEQIRQEGFDRVLDRIRGGELEVEFHEP